MLLKLFLTFLFATFAFAEDEQANQIWDPIEPVNRGIYSFNDTLDVNILEPVAQGYDDVVPATAKTGVKNFFKNLAFPSYLVSDLVQFDFTNAGLHTARFAINSTIGLFGLIDVASDMGIEHKETDFGVALANYDVPPGPYIVLPFLGPSNLRDGFGRIVDTLLDPLYWLATDDDIIGDDGTRLGVTGGLAAIKFVDQRARLLDAIKSGKESSLDFYLFSQSSYYQYREGLLEGDTSSSSQWDNDD